MRFVERILAETEYKKWIPTVSRAITTMFQGEDAASGIGQTVYDADCLDKLGHMGVAQLFSRNGSNSVSGTFIGKEKKFSFCLLRIKGLPRKLTETERS